MQLPENYSAEERIVIEKKYNELLGVWRSSHTPANEKKVEKAFLFAAEAHKNERRHSGEPYLYHPLAVATIVAGEMDLGCTSIQCALLHDVVEDTEFTLDDMESVFGAKVREIVDGLTKIDKLSVPDDESMQAVNFKKIISTMLYDIRTVFIKIADRLHNMRTLGSMPYHKKLRISSETMFIYAPLAYRLGLYAIKRELEDLSLQYTDPKVFKDIRERQVANHDLWYGKMTEFFVPVKEELERLGINARIEIVERSVSDIWLRMREKEIPFEEVYDTWVGRIIINSENPDCERIDCWRVYGVLTKYYYPCTNRLRDWISFPKANGYESLHAQMMGRGGDWVEVQIRTERMHAIAERGMLGYLCLGGKINNENFDKWVELIKESFFDANKTTNDIVNDIKLNLFADEIFVFARNGRMFSLPKNSTVLDFAYYIHTELGNHCVGASVNHAMVQADHVLNHGDRVEIITSDKQEPQEKWFDFIVTARAKSQLKNGLKDYRKRFRDEGKRLFFEMLEKLGVEPTPNNKGLVKQKYNCNSNTDMYYYVATKHIDFEALKGIFKKGRSTSWLSSLLRFGSQSQSEPESKPHLLEDHSSGKVYVVAPCCNPIPGDNVVAFSFNGKPLEVHRANCKVASKLMSSSGRNMVKAQWTLKGNVEFLAGLRIIGSDVMGFGTDIINTITNQMRMNMQSLQMKSKGSLAVAIVSVYVNDTEHLEKLIDQLKKLPLVNKVIRIDKLTES